MKTPRHSKKRKHILDGRLKITGRGAFSVDVVGESNYQESISKIVDKPRYAQKTCNAALVMENTNFFDCNAVRVDIDGRTVGYLRRAVAPVYRKLLAEKGFINIEAVCRARIRGGGELMYGVWLDI